MFHFDSPLWLTTIELVDYETAIKAMEKRIEKIKKEFSFELIWCLQHPSLFTAGTSAKSKDLLYPDMLPVYHTGRGGQYTYHGPGQLVVYPMIDIKKRHINIRHYVTILEEWIINTLKKFYIIVERKAGRIGLWVTNQNGEEEKIASIGVRITHGVTWHGFSINVNPNLEYFKGIVPCGLPNHGVTSLKKLNIKTTVEDVIEKLKDTSPF